MRSFVHQQRDGFVCFDGGASHTGGGHLERWCGKGWWHLPLLGHGGSLARTALRVVPGFGLAALVLSHGGKNQPLALVLRNAFSFFLCYSSFPGDFLGFINDCISLRHDSCSFTSSRVNLESGQAKMLNPSFLLPLVLWPPPCFPISTACIAITRGLAFSLQDWAEIQVLYRAKQISSILARQSKMLEHMWFLLADFSPSLMVGLSVKFPLKYA